MGERDARTEGALTGTHGADRARLLGLTGAKWTYHDDDVIPAWVADMDYAPVPAAVDAVRALVDAGDFGYNMDAELQLPDVFQAWQSQRHGWKPDRASVRLFCDVMQAVEVALWVNLQPGDGVVLFTPVYPPFIKAVESNGFSIVDCPLDPDGWRLDSARLEAAIGPATRCILMCSPHNPTGRVFDRAELAAIAEVAERHDLLVISDEIWADLVFPGSKHVPFASLGEEAARRTITVTAASKAFNLAGLRCALAHLGHAPTKRAIKALPGHLFGAVGSPGAEAMRAAWTQGSPWLATTLEHLLARRDQLARRLARDLPEVHWEVPEATYVAWLDVRGLGLGDDPASHFLEKARVALSAGPDFGPHGAGFARLNFATSAEILDEIVDRLVSAARAG